MAKKDSERIRQIREKANEQRRLEQRAARRRATLIQSAIIVGVLAVVGAIAAVTVLGNNSKTPQAVPSASGTVSILQNSGIPFSVEDTAVTVGKKDAPVIIDIYEDFSCPHCAEYEAQVGPTISRLIADGDVQVSYHPIRFVSAYGQTAGSAATCVAAEDPQNWPSFHMALFENYSRDTANWKPRDFVALAESVGVSDSEALECIASNTYADWIMSNTKTAQEAGVNGTPSLFINGEKVELLNAEGLAAAVADAKSQ